MAIYSNGVLIPENVANTITINGTNITQVIANGVVVWTQNLFSGVWSGTSLTSTTSAYGGIDTSGTGYRGVTVNLGLYYYGPWLYSSEIGLGTGTSVATAGANTAGFLSTSTTLQARFLTGTSSTYITLDISTKSFSGSSYIYTTKTFGLETSGGLLRARSDTTYSAYISIS